jgi:hypothetical protein
MDNRIPFTISVIQGKNQITYQAALLSSKNEYFADPNKTLGQVNYYPVTI